jgi:penicillin amidase
MQMDTMSPIDLELARDVASVARDRADFTPFAADVALLSSWNGRFDPSSKAATLARALRLALSDQELTLGALLERLRRSPRAPGIDAEDGLRDALSVASDDVRPWGIAGGQSIEHPLSPLNLSFLNGASLPGAGDEFTIHLQEPGFSQGFRAVWDVGDWDRGGIAIPSGESGEPGSPHYTDLTRAWVTGRLQPLPFSRAAVRRSATGTLVLNPR